MFKVSPRIVTPESPLETAKVAVRVTYSYQGQIVCEEYEADNTSDGIEALDKIIDRLYTSVRIPFGFERAKCCSCCGKPIIGGDDRDLVMRALKALR